MWRGNHFYCFDHAIEAMGKGNSESEENFEMFTHWNEVSFILGLSSFLVPYLVCSLVLFFFSIIFSLE